MLRKAGVDTKLAGKDVLPMAGEYTTQVMRDGLRAFLKRERPESLQTHPAVAADSAAPETTLQVTEITRPKPAPRPAEQPITFHKHVAELAAVVPPRPAGFCTGCPERPIFSALTLAQEKLGQHHISCDIGCHLFSILPPFNLSLIHISPAPRRDRRLKNSTNRQHWNQTAIRPSSTAWQATTAPPAISPTGASALHRSFCLLYTSRCV